MGSYCGKDCAACRYREQLDCPGCGYVPGRVWPSTCQIARCCQGKGRESCQDCGANTFCGKLRDREEEPRRFLARREAEEEAFQRLREKARLLGRWLWPLFWLFLPALIAGFLTEDWVARQAPALGTAGQVLDLACNLAYGVILLQMARENSRYKVAGICTLAVAALSLVAALLAQASGDMALVLALPQLGCSIAGQYSEYTAHSQVLQGVDFDLSEKWRLLWRWNLAMLLATFGSILVMLASPLLGLLVFLAAGIGTIVVGILKLAYLYRMARLFRSAAL